MSFDARRFDYGWGAKQRDSDRIIIRVPLWSEWGDSNSRPAAQASAGPSGGWPHSLPACGRNRSEMPSGGREFFRPDEKIQRQAAKWRPASEWSEWGDLNSRPPAPKAGALPTAQHPVIVCRRKMEPKAGALPPCRKYRSRASLGIGPPSVRLRSLRLRFLRPRRREAAGPTAQHPVIVKRNSLYSVSAVCEGAAKTAYPLLPFSSSDQTRCAGL